jgi:hypothetical protein
MATVTPNLNLTLPANGEYFNTWNQPNNGNFTIIDTVVGALQDEIVTARGSTASLNDRISSAIDDSGNLLPSAEILAARASNVYGEPGLLEDRLNAGDLEVFTAREGEPALVNSLAWGADQNKNNCVLSGPTNYMTYTGAAVTINGSVGAPVTANINGFQQVVRNSKSTTISGGAGTYYLSLAITDGGEQYVPGIVAPGTTANGVIGTYATNGLNAMFSDSSFDFVNGTYPVQPGDILTITAPNGNPNVGSYIVLATSVQDPTNLTVNSIAIIGQFPSTGSGFTYTINNPISPQLAFTPTAHAKTFTRVANKIYIGRCVFDGTNVTGLTTYASLGAYAGFTSVSSGNYSLTIPHNLGYFPSRVQLFASQASDFSQPLDLITTDASTDASLLRSAIAQVNDLTLLVKNSSAGVFYQDFGGTTWSTGFIYAVVER